MKKSRNHKPKEPRMNSIPEPTPTPADPALPDPGNGTTPPPVPVSGVQPVPAPDLIGGYNPAGYVQAPPAPSDNNALPPDPTE